MPFTSTEEIFMLASFIAQMSEGVLICDRQEQILLCNPRAEALLGMEQGPPGKMAVASNHFSQRRWRLSAVIDKSLVEYALDEIHEKLAHQAADCTAHFIVQGKAHRVLRVRIAPLMGYADELVGFTATVSDITQQRAVDQRLDFLLQSLSKSARSPLASVRAAVEALIAYPQMEPARIRQFKEIILKEALVLDDILNRVASEYSSLVKTQRDLSLVAGAELVATIVPRAKERLGIVVSVENSLEKIWLRVDRYTLPRAVLFLLCQLKNTLDQRAFGCRLSRHKKFINLDFSWQGSPVGSEGLRQWEEMPMRIENEKSPLTLKEVLSQHEAAIWSQSCPGDPDRSYLRILLAAEEGSEPQVARPLSIVPDGLGRLDQLHRFDWQQPDAGSDSCLLSELSYTSLLREISEAGSLQEIIAKPGELPALIHAMIRSGARIRTVNGLISAFSDAILNRLVGFALQELGPPPAGFALITLGSEGRKEQTLKTDQDNALIIDDRAGHCRRAAEKRQAYFQQLGEKVCSWLHQAGYAFCKGGVMANNPRWCQPLATWKNYFQNWIHAAQAQDLLHSSIFFDFRWAYGDPALVDELRHFLFQSLVGWTGFFRHMAQNAVYFKPPIGLFGKLMVESKGEHRHCLNIKNGMTPIVDFARIHALHHQLCETNTQERLFQLCRMKVLSRQEFDEIDQAYNFMMQLRFVEQVMAMVHEGLPPDNYINPAKLSRIQRQTLKEVFRKIERLQTRLRLEFMGTSDSEPGLA
jgi:CBS domain-containing protein